MNRLLSSLALIAGLAVAMPADAQTYHMRTRLRPLGPASAKPDGPTESTTGLHCSVTAGRIWNAGSRGEVGQTYVAANIATICSKSGIDDATGCFAYRHKNIAPYVVTVVRGASALAASGYDTVAGSCSYGDGPAYAPQIPEPPKATCGALSATQAFPITETANASGVGYADTPAQAQAICNANSTPATKLCLAFRPASRPDAQYTVWISGDATKTADPYYESHTSSCG